MGNPATGVEPETNPEVEHLLRERRAALSGRMSSRERRAEGTVAVAFFLACLMLLLGGSPDGFDWPLAVALVLAHAVAGQARFEIGGGSTSPTFLVLVPALFLEPPEAVPLIIAAGCVCSRLPDYLRRTAHPEGLLSAPGNAWHALGPAVVLTVAGQAQTPGFGHAGWYAVALLSYVLVDLISGFSRQWAAFGVRPALQFRLLARVYVLDLLLAPVGFMGALADTRERYAFLLTVPLVAVLGILAQERSKRLDNALALSESRAELLEAELEATRARVEVLGAVSHGLQTPLAGVVAIAGVLTRSGRTMEPDAVVQAASRLEGDAVALRQLVRQGLDYVRLVEGGDLGLRLQDVDVTALATQVVARTPGATAAAGADPGPAKARADAARLEQVLMTLLGRALPTGTAAVTVVARPGTVALTVQDAGTPLTPDELAALTRAPSGARGTDESQGTGVDLYVAAQIADALGGTLEPADGSRPGITLTLPAS